MRITATFTLFLVLFVPASPTAQGRRAIPAPVSVFGFEPGADYKLANYDQSIEYFRKLAAASPLVKLVEAGRTSQGRVMYFAFVNH